MPWLFKPIRSKMDRCMDMIAKGGRKMPYYFKSTSYGILKWTTVSRMWQTTLPGRGRRGGGTAPQTMEGLVHRESQANLSTKVFAYLLSLR